MSVAPPRMATRARDLRPGMVVMLGYGRDNVPREVADVTRAIDEVSRLQAVVTKARTKPSMRDAAVRLVAAIDAIDICGREARIVTFVDYEGAPRTYSANEELRHA